MKLTKHAAAAKQIDQAIGLFFQEDYPCALTLAGAAECCMPHAGPVTLFAMMKTLGQLRYDLSETELVSDYLNQVRNWLKHWGADQPPEIYLKAEDAAIMILRAYTKFTSLYDTASVSDEMLRFEKWFRANSPCLRGRPDRRSGMVRKQARAGNTVERVTEPNSQAR
jgi:hypothetical protein